MNVERIGSFSALRVGEGRSVLFLHGFPDHPPTGQAFFDQLAGRGHEVIAPWLRGYAPSPIEGPYDRTALVADLRSIIEAMGGDPVDVVGHDWGAVLTYALCQEHPALVRRAVTMAVPHPITFARQLRTRAQLRASWYMFLFQIPGVERIVRARDFRFVDRLWRRWSPNLRLDQETRASLKATLAASMPAPLHYYRAAARHAREDLRAAAKPIVTPVLALHGADDGCILPPTEDDRRRFAGEYERETIPNVGHFMHVETPVTIAARVSAWLA